MINMQKNKLWEILESRYGKAGSNAVQKFGNGYFNGIRGWQIPEDELRQANKEEKLLTMDLDFPGTKCKLDCIYCFAKIGEKTGTYYRPHAGDAPLSLEEVKSAVREAKGLGLKYIKVIGYREAFENPDFLEFVDFISGLGIHIVVFTAAYTLGEENFGGDLDKAINFLAERNVSLMIKLHNLNREKEDEIVRCEGFSESRDRILKKLLADGRFTNQSPTRLGLENVISSQDTEELLAIYEYFKIWRNVFVDLDPPIPMGRTGTLEEAEKAGLMPQDKLKYLCVKTYQINKKYGILIRGVSPYFGGDPCTQLSNGLYLTLSGKVMTCCGGDEEIGNVRKQSIKEIFEHNSYRKKYPFYHNCPYREKRGIMTQEFIKEVEKEIL